MTETNVSMDGGEVIRSRGREEVRHDTDHSPLCLCAQLIQTAESSSGQYKQRDLGESNGKGFPTYTPDEEYR